MIHFIRMLSVCEPMFTIVTDKYWSVDVLLLTKKNKSLENVGIDSIYQAKQELPKNVENLTR